jgi:hypothetical protein
MVEQRGSKVSYLPFNKLPLLDIGQRGIGLLPQGLRKGRRCQQGSLQRQVCFSLLCQ